MSNIKSVIDKGRPLQATCLTFSDPPLLTCCHPLPQHWVLCPIPLAMSSTAQLPCIVHSPLLLCLTLPDRLASCPLPPSSCCVVRHPITSHCVHCRPIALHHPPPTCLTFSTPSPLIVFSANRMPYVFYLPLLSCHPLPAHPLHALPQVDCCIVLSIWLG